MLVDTIIAPALKNRHGAAGHSIRDAVYRTFHKWLVLSNRYSVIVDLMNPLIKVGKEINIMPMVFKYIDRA